MFSVGKHTQNGAEENGHSLPSSQTAEPQENLSDMEESPHQPSSASPADRGKRTTDSPAHSPDKSPSAKKHHWADIPGTEAELQAEHTTSQAAFPASDAPASENTLKAMLLSLQIGLQNELCTSISYLANRMDDIDNRTEHLENQITEVVKVHDEMVDVHEEHAEQISKLQLKVADLEDHSRRNNLKIRGVPKAVKPNDLIPYLQQLFLKTIPNLTPKDLLMDRAHRIPKPAHLPDTVPRDVLTRIYFYHIKERLLCG